MKINDLLGEFTIATTNEEKAVINKLDRPMPLSTFTERDQFILENLIRKSLVSKIRYNNTVLVLRNDTKI